MFEIVIWLWVYLSWFKNFLPHSFLFQKFLLWTNPTYLTYFLVKCVCDIAAREHTGGSSLLGRRFWVENTCMFQGWVSMFIHDARADSTAESMANWTLHWIITWKRVWAKREGDCKGEREDDEIWWGMVQVLTYWKTIVWVQRVVTMWRKVWIGSLINK